MPNNIDTPVVPEYITVHLGLPDQPAENVRVPFVAYIANILAQISYAMNRIYTEYYRSRGYDFDITSTTQYDQKFILNRDIFENISQIVDHIFNDYVVKQGTVQPYFTQYCNGTTTTCPGGLSQWGTVPLAEQGMSAEEIVRSFYGDDINFVRNAPIAPFLGGSWPGVTFRLGDVSEEVRIIQNRLNRISTNYPNIPKIYPVDGIFDADTERAVRAFQQQFNLPFRHFREVLIVFHAPAHRHGVRLPMFQQTAEVSRSPVYPLPMHRLLPALQPSANPLRQSHGPDQ